MKVLGNSITGTIIGEVAEERDRFLEQLKHENDQLIIQVRDVGTVTGTYLDHGRRGVAIETKEYGSRWYNFLDIESMDTIS